MPPTEILVWDRFVRFFHWTLVVSVCTSVVSAHLGAEEIHMVVGYGILGLLLARLIWGFIGTPFARFTSFANSPFAALHYLAELVQGHPRRYLGHNPAGGWMVFALLALIGILSISGLVLQATVEFEGPLVGLLAQIDDASVRQFRAVHDVAVNALYALVPLHLLGVAVAARQHRENLVAAMLHGRKRRFAHADTRIKSNQPSTTE